MTSQGVPPSVSQGIPPSTSQGIPSSTSQTNPFTLPIRPISEISISSRYGFIAEGIAQRENEIGNKIGGQQRLYFKTNRGYKIASARERACSTEPGCSVDELEYNPASIMMLMPIPMPKPSKAYSPMAGDAMEGKVSDVGSVGIPHGPAERGLMWCGKVGGERAGLIEAIIACIIAGFAKFSLWPEPKSITSSYTGVGVSFISELSIAGVFEGTGSDGRWHSFMPLPGYVRHKRPPIKRFLSLQPSAGSSYLSQSQIQSFSFAFLEWGVYISNLVPLFPDSECSSPCPARAHSMRHASSML